MEFIDGVNLREIMLATRQAARPLAPALCCHVLSEVAAGLDYAHRKSDHHGGRWASCTATSRPQTS